MKDWTYEDIEAYNDFMESWANSYLCDTQDARGSQEPKIEFKVIELQVPDRFFP
jgi:hypothetical protein